MRGMVMSHRWTSGFLVLCSLWTAAFVGLHHVGNWTHSTELAAAEETVSSRTAVEINSTETTRSASQVAPQKAYDLLAKLQQRDGVPLPDYVGGKAFRNREHRLPPGRYREYDVNRKMPGRTRDAERIVIEQRSGKAYYTGDHYRTFIPLN